MVFSKKIDEYIKTDKIKFMYMENYYSSNKITYSISKWNITENKCVGFVCKSIMNKTATDIIWNDVLNGIQLY